MKKSISILLVFFFVASILMIPCNATASQESEVIYLEDGSYYVVTLTTQNARVSGKVTASKTQKYYNADDELQWTYKLTGTFTYASGTSAVCTVSVGNVTIEDNDWRYTYQRAYADGNIARGEATVIRKYLGVTIKTVSANLSITCDTDGNLT